MRLLHIFLKQWEKQELKSLYEHIYISYYCTIWKVTQVWSCYCRKVRFILNLVSVEKIRNKSRVIDLSYQNPIRIFQTEFHKKYASIILSNHGGGMLQGDIMDIGFNCGKDANIVIGNQANTHIFKNKMDIACRMNLVGNIKKGGEVIVKAEPVVMHRDAIYKQQQTWNLTEGSSLFLVDWMQSGRSESGESFSFKHYSSKMTINIDNNTVFKEKFACTPDIDNPLSFANFLGMDHIVTIIVIGGRYKRYLDKIDSRSESYASRIYPLKKNRDAKLNNIYFSKHPLTKCEGWVIRLLAKTRKDLESFIEL